ncbi:MAG: hypothetical protein IJ155_06900 [Prevotella sp.]|nr:hypothetical protein [Prevotella sp.]
MKKPLLFLLLLTTVLSTSAQLTLNANGEYELKVTEQFSGISAKTLYESSLVALSDIVNSNYVRSSADCLNERDFSIRAFNDLLLEVLDVSRYMQKEVMDKDAGLIVSKGNLLVEVPKTHAESGYSASYVLKIHCKDGRVQYILTVPGILIGRWPTGSGRHC